MVTNYPQEMTTSPPAVADASADETRGILSRLWMRVQHTVCGLHGHDNLLHFDQNRMFLRCVSCGYETPGWELEETRPRLRFHGDRERQVLRHPVVLASRRVA
jgi:hypothetical protein